jgi:hypothetical protein
MPARLAPLNGGAPIQLDKPIILIGRHPECDVVIANSGKVSRRHCCVAQINGAHRIRDLGSMNGIRVNGTRVTEAVLSVNDQVGIGDVIFAFQIDAAAPQRPAAPPQQNDATLPPSFEAPLAPESFAPAPQVPIQYTPHPQVPPPQPAPAQPPYQPPYTPPAQYAQPAPPPLAPAPAAQSAPPYNAPPQHTAPPPYSAPPQYSQPYAPPASGPAPVIPPMPAGYGSAQIPPPPSYSVPNLPPEWAALHDAPPPYQEPLASPPPTIIPAPPPPAPVQFAPPPRFAPPPAPIAGYGAVASHHAGHNPSAVNQPSAPIPLHPGQPPRAEYAAPAAPVAPPAPPVLEAPPARMPEPVPHRGTVTNYPIPSASTPPAPVVAMPAPSAMPAAPAVPFQPAVAPHEEYDEHHQNRGTVVGFQPPPPPPPAPHPMRSVAPTYAPEPPAAPQPQAPAPQPPAPPAPPAQVWQPPQPQQVWTPPPPPQSPPAAPAWQPAAMDDLPPMPPLPLEKPVTASQFVRSSISGAGHPSVYGGANPGFVSGPITADGNDTSGPPSLEIPVAIDQPYAPMPQWNTDPSSVQPPVRPPSPDADIRLKDID